MMNIDSYTELSAQEFDSLIQKDIPFIIKQASFGPCLNCWNVDYLCKKLPKKQVVIHQAQSPLLNFLDKNFEYKISDFCDFLQKCSSNEETYYYLRATGNDKRGKEVANLMKHFPEIADDVQYPDFLNLCSKDNCPGDQTCPSDKHLFSSILRISSKHLTVWTHYDVLDNVLLQIKGRKRVILFPPNDATKLYLKGDKSQIIDLDSDDLYQRFPLFEHVKKYKCILEEGDALFIPSMWFHNTKALDFSIGINFFWKCSQLSSFYDNSDVYGNKDFIPAQNAFANLDKALKHLSKLPDKYRTFYIQMIISKIQN